MSIAEPVRVLGHQKPRFIHSPSNSVDNRAHEAAELMAAIKMPLDPWQILTLETWLGVRADGAWSASSAGILVARQNGKNALLEARELAGLFLFGERRIVHSAHESDTAREAYKRMRNLIESVPWLESEVRAMPKSPTAAIVLKNGAELSYRTRTKGGARGFSAPVVVLDEAQELSADELAAIQPLVSSYSRRQLLYTGTVLPTANVFHGVVKRGRDGLSESLGYVEWSADEDDDPASVEAWLAANPSIGYRMTVDAVRDEWETAEAALTVDKFRMERLSIWPSSAQVGSVIPLDAWAAGLSGWAPPFTLTGGVVGVAVTMDHKYGVVSIALPSPRGTYVECIAQTGDVDMESGDVRRGIDWILPFLQGLQERQKPTAVVIDQAGPASSLLAAMMMMGLPVRITQFQDWKAATNNFVDAVIQHRVEHSGQIQLTESAQGVQWRTVGENQVYDRKTAGVNVAPVEAVTLAAWGLNPDPKAKEFFIMNLNDFMGDEDV